MGVKERKALERKVRRNQILDAARALLLSVGINNISISKISKRAELSVGSIYFYYRNKEEIFIALQEEGVALLYTKVLHVSKKDIGHKEKLIQIAMIYYRFSEDQKDYFDIINYFVSSPTIFFKPDLKTQIDMSARKILLVIREIILDGISQKVFTENDPYKFLIMFWATLHGLIQFKRFEKTVLGNKSHEQLYRYSLKKLISSIKYIN